MKNKLTNFGVYIVKKLFFPVYDKIWTEGWNDYQKRQEEEEWIDRYGWMSEEPWEEDDDIDDDVNACDDFREWPPTEEPIPTSHEAFAKWYSTEASSDKRFEDFLNNYMNYTIVGNLWIYNEEEFSVSIAEPCRATSGTWEIYSKNQLFSDCERYETKRDALTRTYWLLHLYKPWKYNYADSEGYDD